MRPSKKRLIAALAAACMPFAAVASSHAEHGPGMELNMMDTNKDGKVSLEEHAIGAKGMFDKMDANKDGTVTADEMTAGHKAVTGKAAKKTDMSSKDKIKAVDADGDGKLTAAEHAKASDAMFSKMDADKDGFLTRQEMAAGHAAMLKKH